MLIRFQHSLHSTHYPYFLDPEGNQAMNCCHEDQSRRIFPPAWKKNTQQRLKFFEKITKADKLTEKEVCTFSSSSMTSSMVIMPMTSPSAVSADNDLSLICRTSES